MHLGESPENPSWLQSGEYVNNLKYMRGASNYPDFPYIRIPIAELRELPISQATLDQIAISEEFGQVRLDQITWYHHISISESILLTTSIMRKVKI